MTGMIMLQGPKDLRIPHSGSLGWDLAAKNQMFCYYFPSLNPSHIALSHIIVLDHFPCEINSFHSLYLKTVVADT